MRYPALRTTSSRLGGTELGADHEIGPRGSVNDDSRTPTASFTKAKRVRGEIAVAGLRKHFPKLDAKAVRAPTDIMQIMLLMRDESDRKHEARRAEDLKRRRDNQAEKDERRREEREQREQRRHEDRDESEEADERRRLDKEEAHARTQEILLLIGAISKRA